MCRSGTSTHYSNMLYNPQCNPHSHTHGECLFATNMQSYSPFAKMTTIHPFLQNLHSLLLPVPIILLLPLLFVLVNALPMDIVSPISNGRNQFANRFNLFNAGSSCLDNGESIFLCEIKQILIGLNWQIKNYKFLFD